MKRFLTVLIASMFLAAASYAQEKKADEKKTPMAEGKAETKGEKKAAKKEKTAKTEKAAKDDKATTAEKSEKMKDKKDK
jgi:hypothetical protein